MKYSLIRILLGLIALVAINVCSFLLLREVQLIYKFSILRWIPIFTCIISFYVAGKISKKVPFKLTVLLLIGLLVFKPFRYFYFPFIIVLLLYALASLSLTRKEIHKKYKFGIGGIMLTIFIGYMFSQPLVLQQKGFMETPDGHLENATILWGNQIGEKKLVPSSAFVNENGLRMSLTEFQGKIVYVNFWATWCAPCLQEKPLLDKMKTKFSDKEHIVFIDISIDSNQEKWHNFLNNNDVEGIQLHTNGNEIRTMQAFNFSGLPYHIIITPDGYYKQNNDLDSSEQFLNKQ